MRLLLGIFLVPGVFTSAASGQTEVVENVEAEASAEARDPTESTWDFWLDAVEEYRAFGGRTVYFFETGAASFDDWLGSLGLSWLVNENWRAELDYRLQAEEVSGANQQGREGLLDHAVGFAAWYRREDRVISKFWLRTQNRALAQIGLRGSFIWPAHEAGIDYMISAQLATLRQIHENEDPYFAILGESRPHLRWRLDGWQVAVRGGPGNGLQPQHRQSIRTGVLGRSGHTWAFPLRRGRGSFRLRGRPS